MGKKNQQNKSVLGASAKKLLPVSKRNELNLLVDQLLKNGFQNKISIADQWNQYTEMKLLIERIMKIEAELKVKNSTGKTARAGNIENFYKWSVANNCEFDGVKISEFSGYEMGLEATKDWKKGDTFIKIPQKMIFSFDKIEKELPDVIKNMPMIQMQNISLAIFLVIEKIRPNSFWKPYLDLLPEKYSTVMYFSSSEMQELKDTTAFIPALYQCKNIARQYSFLYKYLRNIKNEENDEIQSLLTEKFTYELYCWAVSTVMTRQNIIPSDVKVEDNKSQAVLIPFWDMANHINGILTTGYNDELEMVESQAMMDFKKGEQIFIYYGNRNNTDLLIHNGFVYPENDNKNITIHLSLSSSDELFEDRSKLLGKLNIQKSGDFSLFLSNQDPTAPVVSSDLLGFVRVFNMSKEQISSWLENDRVNDLVHIDCALETSLESKSWTFLQTRLFLLLKVFPTSLEDDIALLSINNKGKMGHIRSMITQFRINEKKILSAALEFVKSRVKA